MFSYAIAVHNTGIYLLERHETDEGLTLLHDALTLVRATFDSSKELETLMMTIQERHTNALIKLSAASKDQTSNTKLQSHSHFFCVDSNDLLRRNLSNQIMSSNTYVVVRLDEENHSEDTIDMISAVILQNLASVYSFLATHTVIERRKSIELLLLSRTLQLKILNSKNESSANHRDCVVTCSDTEKLQLLTITLWRLVEAYTYFGNYDASQQANFELVCAQRRFLHVFSATERFSFSPMSAPCA
jgi:hypothetical protein